MDPYPPPPKKNEMFLLKLLITHEKEISLFSLFYCRDNPERIFELFVEIGKPSNDDEGKLFSFHLKLVISNSGMSLITS